jgi:SAM-dependent methyltransferase
MGFKFPVPPGYHDDPVWMGNGFQIGCEHIPVLQYAACDSGWNSDLTEFHETEADQGNHYIDRASRLHAVNELVNNLPVDGVVLEIGSSSGYLLRDIKKTFPGIFIIGSDCIPEPLEKIAQRYPNIPLIQFDLATCPLPENCVDVIIALNVLEHIKDDIAALRQIHRILKPGGSAIIEVPANPNLYDFYDEKLKHFRRYSLEDLTHKAESAGFTLQGVSHLGFFVYPVFRFVKLRNKQKIEQTKKQTKDSVKHLIHMGGPVMNQILYFLMRFELILGKVIRYPWGIRCLITIKREK